MRTALYYIGIGLILVLFLNSSGPNLDIRDVLKSYIIARYYGWEPKEEDLEEEMITQYTCYYNAIKRWESNHKETEILHQLEISNLLEQLKNN